MRPLELKGYPNHMICALANEATHKPSNKSMSTLTKTPKHQHFPTLLNIGLLLHFVVVALRTCNKASLCPSQLMATINSVIDAISSADLSPTEHSFLKHFIQQAIEPEVAAQYIQSIINTRSTDVENSLRQFKRNWRKLTNRR